MSNIVNKLCHWWQQEPKNREALFYRKLQWKLLVFFLAWYIPKQLYLFLTPELNRAPESFYLGMISISVCFHFMLFPIVAIFRKGFWKIVLALGWLLGITYPVFFAIYMYVQFFRPITFRFNTTFTLTVNKTMFVILFLILILYDLAFFLAYAFWIVRKAKKFDAAYSAPLKEVNP